MARAEGDRRLQSLDVNKSLKEMSGERRVRYKEPMLLSAINWSLFFEAEFNLRWRELPAVLEGAQPQKSAIYFPDDALSDDAHFATVTAQSGRKYARLSSPDVEQRGALICAMNIADQGNYIVPTPFYFGFPGRDLHFLLYSQLDRNTTDFSAIAEAYHAVIVAGRKSLSVKPLVTDPKGKVELFGLGLTEQTGAMSRDTFATYQRWPGFVLNSYGNNLQVYVSDHMVGSVTRV